MNSSTCAASSRVGVRMSARGFRAFFGLAFNICRIGRAKAAVFPVPVCAPAITSRPSRIGGIDCDWIGVAILYPRAVIAWSSSGVRPNFLKDMCLLLLCLVAFCEVRPRQNL